jgi:hypothetical protein
MNAIGSAHAFLARHAPQFCLGALAGSDVQGKIRAALAAADPTPHRRESPLHPVLVFWLVLSLPLFRSLSVPNVFAHLIDAWRRGMRGLPLRPVTDGALAHARKRLGVAPVRHLFEALGAEVQPGASFHGLRTWALDGTVLTVPDTKANEAGFGRHVASVGHTAFPQMRLVTLSSARTHEVRAAAWRPYGQSENEAVGALLPLLAKGDLALLDRGLCAIWICAQLRAQGAHFLGRLRSCVKPRWSARRGPGDYDVRLESLHHFDRAKRGRIAVHARMIEYTLDGRETVRLVTSLTDERITPQEIVALYHERWEQEMGFDEIKTHLSTVTHGTLDTMFRGRSPLMVEQELWATLALYNLVRRLMDRAAGLHGFDARRVSFVDAVEVIRLAVPAVQGHRRRDLVPLYVRLMTDLGRCVMDRWRRPRCCPRAIKIKSLGYRHKKPGERSRPLDALAGLRLGAARCA